MPLNNFSWVIPGKLAGLGMPGSSRTAGESYITADLKELRDSGVHCLVSLQRMPETFGALCGKTGLEWIHFPIMDFETPQDGRAFAGLVETVITNMDNGKPVAVHCRAGIGRTGLLLACIIGRYFRISGEKAIATVRKTREALDTGAQTAFVNEFCTSE